MDNLNKKTAIIISQCEELINITNTYLENKYAIKNTIIAKDPSMGLRMVCNQEFSIIIIDHELPKMNGLQLIERLNKLSYSKAFNLLYTIDKLSSINEKFSSRLNINHICETGGDINLIQDAIAYMFDIVSWSKELETGIKTIDDDHKNLYQLIHRIKTCKAQSVDEVSLLLQELEHHCVKHFKEEEDQMSSLNYLHFEGHQKHHEVIMSNISLLQKSIQGSTHPLNVIKERVYSLTLKWFRLHFTKLDIPFIKHMRKLKSKKAA